MWKGAWTLHERQRTVATVTAKGWGKTPATVSGLDPELDHGLVLFTVWLVQTFRAQDSSSAAAVST